MGALRYIAFFLFDLIVVVVVEFILHIIVMVAIVCDQNAAIIVAGELDLFGVNLINWRVY